MRSWGRSSGGLPAGSRLHSCGSGPGINSRSALLRLCEHIPSKPGVRGWASGKASPQLQMRYDRLLAHAHRHMDPAYRVGCDQGLFLNFYVFIPQGAAAVSAAADAATAARRAHPRRQAAAAAARARRR